jgi:hypothetical protein
MGITQRFGAKPAFFTAAFFTVALAAAACGTGNNDDLNNQDCPTPDDPATTATTGGNTDATTTTTSGDPTAGSGGNTSTSASTGSGNDPDPDPPTASEIYARLHGCTKLRYITLGQMLVNRGAEIPINFAKSSGVGCQMDNLNCTTNSQCVGGTTCINLPGTSFADGIAVNGKCGRTRAVNGVGNVFFPDPSTRCQDPSEACWCPSGNCTGGLTTPSSNGNSFVMGDTGICLKDDNNDDVIDMQDAVFAELLSFGGTRQTCQADKLGNVQEFMMGNNIRGCLPESGTEGQPGYDPGETCYCPESPCFSPPNPTPTNTGRTGFCVPKVAGAPFLYASARATFSVPQFDSRTGEADGHTTASALKLFDIFVMSAKSIIDNISDPDKAPACTRNGKNPDMFAGDGSCSEEGISCIIGYPATDDHMLLCNLIVNKADTNDTDDVKLKREIAIATVLSAAHSCE